MVLYMIYIQINRYQIDLNWNRIESQACESKSNREIWVNIQPYYLCYIISDVYVFACLWRLQAYLSNTPMPYFMSLSHSSGTE